MSVRERKFIVGGNWKMNGTKSTIDGILKHLKESKTSSETGKVRMVTEVKLGLNEVFFCR